MMSEYTYPYPRPSVTVDIVLFGTDIVFHGSVLLIKRRKDPFQGMWALPGGYRNENEQLMHAALRELREETGVTGVRLRQFHTFGNPGRDPRGDTVSVAYTGGVPRNAVTVQADDDAEDAQWFSVKHLPPLAFDHRDIIQYALANT